MIYAGFILLFIKILCFLLYTEYLTQEPQVSAHARIKRQITSTGSHNHIITGKADNFQLCIFVGPFHFRSPFPCFPFHFCTVPGDSSKSTNSFDLID